MITTRYPIFLCFYSEVRDFRNTTVNQLVLFILEDRMVSCDRYSYKRREGDDRDKRSVGPLISTNEFVEKCESIVRKTV